MRVLHAYASAAEGSAVANRLPEGLETGVGKAASAAAMTERLCRGPSLDLVCLFGVCGAYPDADPPLAVADVCLVGSDVLADDGLATAEGFADIGQMELGNAGPFPMDHRFTSRIAEVLGDLPVVRGATVSTCSGTDTRSRELSARTGAHVETMEGAAVAAACFQLGVPLVQIRCVSNLTGDRRTAEMDLPRAIARLHVVILRLVERGWL